MFRVRPYLNYDPIKPKFIYNSDIPNQIKHIVNNHTRSNSLIIHEVQFHLDIELNCLLLRNRYLNPNELIKENVVTLTKLTNNENYLLNILLNKPGATFVLTPEVFIISITLTVVHLKFTPQEITIDFLKDKKYGLLLQLLPEIKSYITRYFHLELNQTPSSIPTLDIIAEINNDSTLDNSENEDNTIDKTITLGIYDKSISNDTLHENITREHTNNSITSTNSSTPSEGSSVEFIRNINNLRHNEEVEQDSPESPEHSNIISTENIINDLVEVECENESDIDLESPHGLKSPIKLIPNLQPPQPQFEYPDNTSDMIRLSRQSSSLYSSSPRKNNHTPSISSKPSFTMINLDQDDTGLEYAFRSSTDVPKYIKNDRKFKFIKVGKVQKYVNLFEEQQTSTPTSRLTSRQPSNINSNINRSF
ncbi:hypothetical protein JA1_003025 [Spathaspora sp. JA1]|nr:hypothetical protein JA1_003025 [Spathaspora sp. JA1]